MKSIPSEIKFICFPIKTDIILYTRSLPLLKSFIKNVIRRKNCHYSYIILIFEFKIGVIVQVSKSKEEGLSFFL